MERVLELALPQEGSRISQRGAGLIPSCALSGWGVAFGMHGLSATVVVASRGGSSQGRQSSPLPSTGSEFVFSGCRTLGNAGGLLRPLRSGCVRTRDRG